MDLSNPIHSVIPTVQGDVLGVLGRTERPLTGRGIAELLQGRAGVTSVSLCLRSLVAAGIVLAEEHPPAILYRLNRKHIVAESVIALATIRERLIEHMREEILLWRLQPYGAWIFGSFARGTAGAHSAIDVLVVRPSDVADSAVWQQQVRDFRRRSSVRTGNDCRVIEFSLTGFTELFTNNDRLAEELHADAIALTRRRLPAIATATLVGV